MHLQEFLNFGLTLQPSTRIAYVQLQQPPVASIHQQQPRLVFTCTCLHAHTHVHMQTLNALDEILLLFHIGWRALFVPLLVHWRRSSYHFISDGGPFLHILLVHWRRYSEFLLFHIGWRALQAPPLQPLGWIALFVHPFNPLGWITFLFQLDV